MLAPTDYEISEAENGEEAPAAIAKQRPATRRIKADASLRSIPIIAVTLMRSAVKDRRREWSAAMTMYRNLTARENCWRKFGRHHQHAHGPIFKKKRTNLDTFAWYTGRLAIGVFDDAAPGGPIEILEVHGEPIVKILSSRRSRSPTKWRADEALDPHRPIREADMSVSGLPPCKLPPEPHFANRKSLL